MSRCCNINSRPIAREAGFGNVSHCISLVLYLIDVIVFSLSGCRVARSQNKSRQKLVDTGERFLTLASSYRETP